MLTSIQDIFASSLGTMDKQQRDSAASWVKRAEINLDVYDIRGALKYIQTAIDKDPKYIKVIPVPSSPS